MKQVKKETSTEQIKLHENPILKTLTFSFGKESVILNLVNNGFKAALNSLPLIYRTVNSIMLNTKPSLSISETKIGNCQLPNTLISTPSTPDGNIQVTRNSSIDWR